MKPILLCNENGYIYPISTKKVNLTYLRIRSRINPELRYYLLRIPESAEEDPEMVIQNIIDYPEFLDESSRVERI